MRKTQPSTLPAIESDYLDEYGEIDREVYLAGTSIWPYACRFALKITTDEVRARDLMLRSIAKVSARKRDRADIGNLERYLLLVYKRIVLEDLRRSRRFEQLPAVDNDAKYQYQIVDLEQTILVREIILKLDSDTSDILEKLMLGFTFNEIAEQLNQRGNERLSPQVLRNKFRRRVLRLAQQIETQERACNGNGRSK